SSPGSYRPATPSSQLLRPSGSVEHLDPADDVALDDPVHYGHPGEDIAEDGELVVEPRVVDDVHEELGVARVASAGRDAERASIVRAEPELVAHERPVADVLRCARSRALHHEVGRDSMESEAVVVVRPGEA